MRLISWYHSRGSETHRTQEQGMYATEEETEGMGNYRNQGTFTGII
jgi:hypothetical protein